MVASLRKRTRLSWIRWETELMSWKMDRNCRRGGWLKKSTNRTRDVDILASEISRMGLNAMEKSRGWSKCGAFRHNHVRLAPFRCMLRMGFRLWSGWAVKLWRRSGSLAFRKSVHEKLKKFLPPRADNMSTFSRLALSPSYEPILFHILSRLLHLQRPTLHQCHFVCKTWHKIAQQVELHAKKMTVAFQENQFVVLPEEIVINILLYLPIKSLLLCRFVCIDWCRAVRMIISTKEFRLTHMTRAIQAQRNKTLELNRTLDYDVSYLVYDSLAYNSHFVEHGFFHKGEPMNCNIGDFLEKNYPDEWTFRLYHVVGSCNGLVVLSDDHDNIPICICNPITLKHMDVPLVEIEFSEHRGLSGFGFAPVSRKYKVVRMECESLDGYKNYVCKYYVHAHIWTVGMDQWREIGQGPMILPSKFDLNGIHVNGTLYWLIQTSYKQWEIMALDLESEEFRKIALPPNLSSDEQPQIWLCNLMERLACVRITKETIFIWHMVPHQGQPRWNQIIIPIQNQPYDDLMIIDPIVQHLLVCCSFLFWGRDKLVPWGKGKPVPRRYFHALSHVGVLTSPSEALEAIEEGAFHDIDPAASIDLEAFLSSSKLKL